MRKLLSMVVIFLMLMIGTTWAGDTTVIQNIAPGTSVNTIWNGTNGTFTLNGVLGPNATTNVWNGGVAFNGSAYLVNVGDNPYGYGVDTTTSKIKATFSGGGYADFDLTRNLSKVSSYGPAGQVVWGSVSSDATGELAMNITTNYAKLVVANYGNPRTTNGKEFEATGNYYIEHGISDGVNGAILMNYGNGTSQISAMSSSAGGALGGSPLAFTFGRGAGCYTDSKIVATGTGTVWESAGANNGLTVWAGPYNNEVNYAIPGNGAPGSSNYSLQIGYSGNFILPNFSISGK